MHRFTVPLAVGHLLTGCSASGSGQLPTHSDQPTHSHQPVEGTRPSGGGAFSQVWDYHPPKGFELSKTGERLIASGAGGITSYRLGEEA